MLSEEYKELFKNDRLVAYIAENLADFAEHEIKEDSLLNVLKRSMDALCDGEYLASIMEYYEYTPCSNWLIKLWKSGTLTRLTKLII